MARTTNKAEELLTFSRASSGTALTKVAYGPELVTNGGFDTASDWTLGTGWTISGGQAVGTAVNGYLHPTLISLPVGTTMRLTFDAVVTSGTVSVRLGSFPSVTKVISSSGTYEIVAPITVVDDFSFQGTSFTGTIDNVSIKEVLYNSPTGTLKLISHPTNKPRVEYDANGVAKGLLIEEARTNLVTYSEDFSSWGLLHVSLQSGLVSPDGSSLATKIVPDTSLNAHFITKANLFASGQTYSLFVKAAGYNYVSIGDGSNTFGAKFDLLNKTATITHGSVTAEIEEHANGWFRIYGTTSSNVQNQFRIWPLDIPTRQAYNSYEGDGTSGIYIWGAQVETGSFPTSYIPTSGATATRSADIASVNVSEFGYNQAQGSVVVEAETFDNSVSNHGDFALVNSGNQNDIASGSRSGGTAAGTYTAWFKTGGSSQALLTVTSAVTSNTNYKAAFCYAANDFALTVDASAIVSDTSGTVPTFVDKVKIGTNTYGYLNGHIKSIKYFPVRLDDDKLKELTL